MHGQSPRQGPTDRARRAIVVAVAAVVLLVAATGCAGRKGRNDDDPGPHDYAPRLTQPALVR